MDDAFPYRDLDCLWLAVDSIGQIAIFASAGSGPVPRPAWATIEGAVAEAIRGLPVRCGYLVAVPPDGLEDWTDFARRGLFAYDWTQARCDDGLYGYELIASPTDPAALPDFDETLRGPIAATLIPGVIFGESDRISRSQLPDFEF